MAGVGLFVRSLQSRTRFELPRLKIGLEERSGKGGEDLSLHARPNTCLGRAFARYFLVRRIKQIVRRTESATGRRVRVAIGLGGVPFVCVFAVVGFFATGLLAQTRVQTPGVPSIQQPAGGLHVNSASHYAAKNSGLGVTGLPAGPSQLPYPLVSTPSNDAWVRNNAWAAYNANLRHIPTAANPNRLAADQKLVDQDRFIQKPNSVHRYNFQFSDNEIRSVQVALRRLGTYSGQVDGILGPDTRRAIEDYQIRNKRPVTGQPDPWLNASLGIF